jgi:putative isomerase
MITGNDEFLKFSYPYLKKNIEWWEKERYDNKLFHYKIHKFESGWDNSVRWDFPNKISNLYSVDCNCFIYSYYDGLEYIADILGLSEESQKYASKKSELKNKINEILYDKENNYYCDYNYKRKRFTGKISPASFMPLFVGIADKEKAVHMSEFAISPEWFFPGIPTISYNSRKYNSAFYWRGPCWLNTAYFTIKGLFDYGYSELALMLIDKVLGWCLMEEEYREYYDSLTGKGLGAKSFGWSAVFAIELVLLKYQILSR